MMSDIFDTSNISDLPKEMQKQLSKRPRKNGVRENIIALFSDTSGKTLTTRQIYVGYYRKFGEQKTMKQLVSVIHTMKKSGTLRSVGGGLYAIKEQPHE